MKDSPLVAALLLIAAPALTAPMTYKVDPNHTYPSFVADHLGGLSNWRGKLTKTSGTIVLDKEARTGTVEVTSESGSIDFGHEKLNAHARSPEMLDAEKFPTITYRGKLLDFKDGVPTSVNGDLTIHGVTKPITLTINQFLCKPHPATKKEVCGADASATINRSDFGVSFGQQFGFKQDVKLEIQVEAGRVD